VVIRDNSSSLIMARYALNRLRSGIFLIGARHLFAFQEEMRHDIFVTCILYIREDVVNGCENLLAELKSR